MAIDENDPRLKDMLRAIELGETLEDLDDPEEYEDQGGINSLKRKAPSIKIASEPEDEFELELGTVIKEYNDLKEQGIIRDISIEEYIDKYLSKKRKSSNMQMAGMGNTMKLFETPYGFDRGAFEDMLIQYEDSGAKDKGIKLYEFATDFLGMVKKDTPKSDRATVANGGTPADEDEEDSYRAGVMQAMAQNRKKAMGGGMMQIPMGKIRMNEGGVIERDYRDKGGFVPVGIKEKADDVPAMLSKNEFVMTADAVRGAGDGSIEKGAQRMYDTMKSLERKIG